RARGRDGRARRVRSPGSQVLAGASGRVVAAAVARVDGLQAGRQRALAHLLQLGAGGHLLGEQRGLDAVEQALQPTDQLGLRDAQLGVGRHRLLGERQGQPFQLVPQLRRQPLLELAHRGTVDLLEPGAAGVVERSGPHLLEQLLDHGADAHDLGRLLDHVGQRLALLGALVGALAALFACHRDAVRVAGAIDLPGRKHQRPPVGTDHDDGIGCLVRMRHDPSHVALSPDSHNRRRAEPEAGRSPWPYRAAWTPIRVADMTYDVARVRGLIPSLGDGWIHLDPQAGMLVPDSVSRAVSTGFRTTSFSHVGRHGAARRSAAVLDAAREAVADLVGGDPAGVVLGPDRAVLLAWLAESLSSRLGLGTGIVLSRLDDEANVAPWLRIANRYGAHVRWAEVEIETCEMPSWQFEELIGPTARLVALTAASPIVGSAPSVRVAAERVHEVGGLLVADAVGAAPYALIDIDDLNADVVALSGPSWGGPQV